MKIYNKSDKDFSFGLNYLSFDDKTYFNEFYVTRVFSGMNKYYTIDEKNVGESFYYTSGEISGSFEYYADDGAKGDIRFKTEVVF